jgi:hypothetical protein
MEPEPKRDMDDPVNVDKPFDGALDVLLRVDKDDEDDDQGAEDT